MFIRINYISGVPTYRQIIEGIREEIARRNLKPMDELPSVRQLALELSVNPNTVARAYRELIQEGTVYSRQGMGFYVRPVETADTGFIRDGLSRLLIEAKVKNVPPAAVRSILESLIGEIYSPDPDGIKED